MRQQIYESLGLWLSIAKMLMQMAFFIVRAVVLVAAVLRRTLQQLNIWQLFFGGPGRLV
ncbi:hypothetical protein [Niabella sp.]|uniref:hypothetical protein n=1 Tax=Niabella sp. TaxID=1962976 RepID=UPI0026305297|nr:hypothetical protein [Niabella sp.]